ncbi:MAG: hypothetical protein IJ774_01990 [Selenomonadaceae bacterium]|nr:hypothetical protein [Selenomonadaceae bacterium]MBR1805136.1 hypothetical protein [Selenomonadaceae bacterium]
MSQFLATPLTPEQIKKTQSVSEEKLREAQDSLFVFLINRVNELETQIAELETPTVKSSAQEN